ncbi:S41 family peptidase [Pseudochryseolinea flava]|uniref:Tail specific protease domain-containing protein n=1 Tax=Pseudochryseolinea flava TaxID=2059302 RepID=A0A364XX39_9BACT|nr:S41 family peptidase [Pseudochryseolinea flava]RAV99004.1 hypothetical protein DQQ10_20620 [Pseudochryseolinea flava]
MELKKIVVSLLALLYIVDGQSQNSLSGKIIDKATQAPLPYATIGIENTSQGTTSNAAGEFTLPTISNAKVRISYIGYRSVVINVSELNIQPVIELEAEHITLGEILITPTDPVDVVYEALNKIPVNYNSTAYRITGFAREYVTADQEIVQWFEAVFEHDGSTLMPRILKSQFMEDKAWKAPLWNSSRGGFYTVGWRSTKALANPSRRNFLGIALSNHDLSRYYTFDWENPVVMDGRDIYVIAFHQRKNVKPSLIDGTIYIDATTSAIVKIKYNISAYGAGHMKVNRNWNSEVVSNSPKNINIRDEQLEITYKRIGNRWYPNRITALNTVDASLSVMGITQTTLKNLSIKSEYIVTKIDTTITAELNSNVEAVGKTPTLQNYLKQHHETYQINEDWNDHLVLKSDTLASAIAASLSMKNARWELGKQQTYLEKTVQKKYSIKEQHADLKYLKETLEKVHPDLFTYQTRQEFEKNFLNAIKNVQKNNSERSFLNIVSALIESIHCGHTTSIPSKEAVAYHQQFGKYFPLAVVVKNDRIFTTSSASNINEASEIKNINTLDVKTILAQLRAVTPTDGASNKDAMISKYFATLYKNHISSADTFHVEYISPLNGMQKAQLPGIDYSSDGPSRITSKCYDSMSTVLITLPSFGGTNFVRHIDSTFNAIHKYKIQNVIIDIRNNEGGYDSLGALLYSHLTDSTFDYYHRILVNKPDTTSLNRLHFNGINFTKALPEFINSINEHGNSYSFRQHRNLKKQTPKQNAFKGKLYVLINGITFSTAAEFASIVHDHHRALFIGESCGGAYRGNNSLGTPTLTLPNTGIEVEIPIGRYELSLRNNSSLQHLEPDIVVEQSLDGIVKGSDEVLEKCLTLIRRRTK